MAKQVKQIKVVYLSERSNEPEVKLINKKLKDYQQLVDGLIEPVDICYYDPFDERMHGLLMYANEEGLLHDYLPNVMIADDVVIFGSVFVAALDEDDDIDSIPDNRINDVINYLKAHKYCG